MKVTTLGAAGAASHYLEDRSFNQWQPAFLVEWDDQKLLLECSSAVQQRLEQVNCDYASIHHVAISHPHPDHCVPIPYIQAVYVKGQVNERYKNPSLTFYAPNHLVSHFLTLWNIYLPERQNTFFEFPTLTLNGMSDGDKSFSIGSGTLTAQKVYHAWGKCDAVGYRLETPDGILAYSGDTGECDGVRAIAKGADLFICEVSARVGDTESKTVYGHLDPFTVGDIAHQANVKKLVLSHYYGLDSNESIEKEIKRANFTGEIIFGKDFQVIDF